MNWISYLSPPPHKFTILKVSINISTLSLQSSSAIAKAIQPAKSSAPQLTVTSSGTSIVGISSSTIVNVAIVETEFPQSSVTTNSTVTSPASPQVSSITGAAGTVVQVRSASQRSVANAFPFNINHKLKSAVLPIPLHATSLS